MGRSPAYRKEIKAVRCHIKAARGITYGVRSLAVETVVMAVACAIRSRMTPEERKKAADDKEFPPWLTQELIDKGMLGESIASDAPLEVRDQTDTKDKYVMSRALEKYITQNRPMLKDRADKIRNHHGKPKEYWVRRCGKALFDQLSDEQKQPFLALVRQKTSAVRSKTTGAWQVVLGKTYF